MSWAHQDTMEWYSCPPNEASVSPFRNGHQHLPYLTAGHYISDGSFMMPPPNDVWQPRLNHFHTEPEKAPLRQHRGPYYAGHQDFPGQIQHEYAIRREQDPGSYSSTTTTIATARDSLSPPASEGSGHVDDMFRRFLPMNSSPPPMIYASPTCSNMSISDMHGVKPGDLQQVPDPIIDDHEVLDSLVDLPGVSEHSDELETGLPTPPFTTSGTGDLEPVIEADDVDSKDDSGDYKPVARQSKHRKAKAVGGKRAQQAHKRGSSQSKVTKTPSKATSSSPSAKKSLSATQCPHCGVEQNSKTACEKHVLSMHTRPFSCIFERYGCKATFGAKNEWKRHCSTQHLRLSFYRCDVGSCPPKNPQEHRHLDGWDLPIASQAECNDFNRKDLFIQHHRRMHAPEGINDATEAEKDRFKAKCEQAAIRCRVSARAPPPRTICGLCEAKGCPVVFEGGRAWETRMEHVGRHLESAKGEQMQWAEDLDLKQWLISEGLLQQTSRGEWRLTDHLKTEEGRSSRR